MADYKQAVGNDNDETSGHAALFADEYDADESNVQHLDLDQSAGTASYSVSRLERDFQTLHKKWQLVEQEISSKQQRVGDLQKALDSIRKDRDALVTQKQTLKDNLEAEKKSAASKQDRVTELENRNNELRVQIQEFEDYIDRRKIEWDKLESQVRDYEDAIRGMGSSIESHDSVLAQKDEEKASLKARVAELKQALAELSGRHGERESAQSDLQKSLKDQSRELGALNTETASLKKEIGKLEKKLGSRDKTIASLRKDLKAHQSNELQVDAVLQSEQTAIAALEKQHEARIAKLELAVNNGEAIEQQLRGDASKAKDTIAELRDNIAELEIRTAELDAMYLESESERQSAVTELDAQRCLVETLEDELSSKRDDLDGLDMSADRLSAIGESIRELDGRIDSHWSEPQKVSGNGEKISDPADEIMIAPDELIDDDVDLGKHFIVTDDDKLDGQIRYPLSGKSVTIGRSRESDIRIISKYISRNHVKIVIDGPDAVIEDAGSTNGFRVNDRVVSRHHLADGDTLLIGKSKFKYEHALS